LFGLSFVLQAATAVIGIRYRYLQIGSYKALILIIISRTLKIQESKVYINVNLILRTHYLIGLVSLILTGACRYSVDVLIAKSKL